MRKRFIEPGWGDLRHALGVENQKESPLLGEIDNLSLSSWSHQNSSTFTEMCAELESLNIMKQPEDAALLASFDGLKLDRSAELCPECEAFRVCFPI